ncbi:hypothetical protein JOF53_002277 [Crossiella equi]|uniref:Glycoside-hydrolase family GH114 TIM-barrel domain-containing protein n=1 Tax=Crossiella equi TaxID=130796 RepID=A0ABS5AA00_9PSEU|nr:endo alpha-1,4 polygalactosaminidase [Crossiella equi]MBP2473405.1 hypothetical protein [Crossiella equi]
MTAACTGAPAAPEEAATSSPPPPSVSAPPPEPAPSSEAPAPAPSEPGRPPATTAPPPPPPPAAKPARWVPKPGSTWQWQLSGPVDTSVAADIYDIDAVGNSREVVKTLQAKGRKVVCYVNAGASEDYRPDAGRLRGSVLGNENGWPGERWLDIRRLDVVLPVMAARFDVCRDKGFDGVEADLVDAYAHDSGHAISAADQLAYNRALARLAHERGLSIGLKNALGLVPQLVGDFDFAVNEQCAEYDECAKLTPFIQAGKAVLHAEYDLTPDRYCGTTRRLGLSSIHKNLNLDAARRTC